MLKKEEFTWKEEAMRIFKELKQTLISLPVMRMPNFNMGFTIVCDASGGSVGAILLQDRRLIAFSSQNLMGKALAFSTYEKEMLTILLVVKK